MKKHYVAAAISAVALLGVTACSSSAAKTSTTAAAPAVKASASAAPFGAGCAAVPTDPTNKGSFDSMSKVPVATAASGNPVLSTLVTAVTAAGLGDTLNNAPALTVFAPDNDAFAKIPAADLKSILANKSELAGILEYHVISGKLAPDQLAGTHTTLDNGKTLTVTGSGTNFTVNGTAMVVCGDVQTANATVYILDSVLTPSK
ncbi:MAG TPA: fasciclin domain-containing protein [Micromonosporaceae bacterium]